MGFPANHPGVLKALAEGRAVDTTRRQGGPAGPCSLTILHPAPPPGISEKDFQALVVETAKARGWEVYHTHDSRRSVEGFPDLVLARERVVYMELKSETGRVSDAQERWQGVLKRAGQETYVLWPTDWPLILEVLK